SDCQDSPEMNKALALKGLVQLLSPIFNPCQYLQLPPRGLESLPLNASDDSHLRQSTILRAAQSGAVGAEPADALFTAERLAAALRGSAPADRARLAALLLGRQPVPAQADRPEVQ